ncbi:MAG: hypothetical protein KJ069_11370 [Anaerolineae bacterium]|nr:hypothetical protein [Anaerolineae bacterium]
MNVTFRVVWEDVDDTLLWHGRFLCGEGTAVHSKCGARGEWGVRPCFLDDEVELRPYNSPVHVEQNRCGTAVTPATAAVKTTPEQGGLPAGHLARAGQAETAVVPHHPPGSLSRRKGVARAP